MILHKYRAAMVSENYAGKIIITIVYITAIIGITKISVVLITIIVASVLIRKKIIVII